MSYNNHDSRDPNAVKYVPSKTAKYNLHNIVKIDSDDDNFEAQQVWLIAKSMPYSQWKKWLDKSGYQIIYK